MPRFRFGLEKVLELRERTEQESAAGLARARAEAHRAEAARDALETARSNGRARLAEAHGAGGSVGHLQNLSYVLGQVDGKIAEADTACRAAEQEVTRSMASFREAVRQRSAIGQLRDRQEQRWRADESQKERKEMDEIATTRHGRGTEGSGAGGA